MVKKILAMNASLLSVSLNMAEPRLCNAGLAWVDMALELFAQEIFSVVRLDWWRETDGTDNQLLLSLDSSKNFTTKNIATLPGAPADIGKRRERFDVAVEKLLSRTTAEDLWAALSNQILAKIDGYYLLSAWKLKTGSSTTRDTTYPTFTDSREFLFYMMKARELPPHPWV
jgi:hypothetical protein